MDLTPPGTLQATTQPSPPMEDLPDASDGVTPAEQPEPLFGLIGGLLGTAARLREFKITDLIDAARDPNDAVLANDPPTNRDRRLSHLPLVRRGPVGEDAMVRSRQALVASIDEAAVTRLKELHLKGGDGPSVDLQAVKALLRCWRRLRSIAETGLFLHDYYAYQTRVTGSPFTLLMHYLNEVPEAAAQPNPLFNTNYYLTWDVRKRGSLHPFVEYALIRRRRGATTHWSFSDVAYAQRAQVEIKDAMSHCLAHYADYAKSEASSDIARTYASADVRAIESFIFDPECYSRLYHDLQATSPTELVQHYLTYGEREGRIGCVVEHLHRLGVRNVFIPIDFHPREYGELNPDVASSNVKNDPLFALEHYLIYGLREGRSYTREAFKIPHSAARPDDATGRRQRENLPVGIFVHMFYPEMWETIRRYLHNMCNFKHRLLINLVTSSFDPDVFREIRQEFPDAEILVSPNEGRDIGGLFRLFAEVDFNDLGAVAICHSKKSPHLTAGLGETWMRDLMDAYAETPERFEQSLDTIQHHPDIGIIASAKWRRIGVGEANDRHYKVISALLPGLKGQNPEYISGTMFLAKPSVVGGVFSALRHLEFESGDDLELTLHIDGQIAHSIERAFGHMTRSLAMRILWQ